MIGLKKLAPLFQPIKLKTKPTATFPSFRLFIIIFLTFEILVILTFFPEWLLRLLCFWFYETQSKILLVSQIVRKIQAHFLASLAIFM